MDFDLGEGAAALRSRLRELIAEEIPAGYLGAFTDDPADLDTAQAFCRKLAADGLLTWSWPQEYGGSGGSVWEQTVVREEMWAHHEPRGAQYMGLNWVGPAIMAFGTDEQKARFLPPIAAGDVIWCQGFSEPGAGSDLASLTTRAEPDGDGWRVNGQKIWTSYAQMAQWCVLAARIGPMGERKHEGITIFLLPMDRPGITVQPIRSMLGPHHLNEVFFDDVRVEPGEVLGAEGGGWEVIRRALAHERVGIARYARCDRLMSRWAGEPAGMDSLPEHLRTQWVRALVAVRVSRLLAYRAVADQEAGQPAEVSASAARLAVTQCDQQVAELLFQAVEEHSFDNKTHADAPLNGAIEDHWRYAQAATVASGTVEIQRMIVSRDPDRVDQMNPALPDAAAEFGATADKAVSAAGGTDLARAAESDPSTRSGPVRRLLDGLGLGELDPAADDESAAAAAELCRIAGRWALPYPVGAVLVGGETPFALGGEGDLRVDHGDLYPVWRLARPGATASSAVPAGGRLNSKLGPFVTAMETGDPAGASRAEVALALTFSAWRILGALERAVDLAVEHVRDRQQFGQSLSKFQAVQFQIADAVVAVDGLRELSRWTLWRVLTDDRSQLVDPLALRLHALEAGRQVLRTCQQLFGASGLCDEYDISYLVRHIQPELRLPWGVEQTAVRLFDAVRADGFESLFPHGGGG